MRRATRIVIVAIAALGSGCGASAASGASSQTPSSASQAGPQYTVQFRAAAGASWRLHLLLDNDIAGQHMRVESDSVQRVVSIDAAGLREVETRCETMQLRAPVEQPSECPPPEIAHLDGSARPHDPGETERVAGSTSNGRPVFLAYPPRPVAVGDTWHDIARWRQPGSTDLFSVDATYTLVSVTPRADDLDAVVRMTGALTMTDERDVPPADRGGAEGRVTGEFVLEVSDGFMREMTFDMDFVVRVPASEGGGSAPVRVHTVAESERLP